MIHTYIHNRTTVLTKGVGRVHETERNIYMSRPLLTILAYKISGILDSILIVFVFTE